MRSLSGRCVLVVEDEAIVALDLASLLEDAGADVLGPALTLDQAEIFSDDPRIAVAVLDVRLGTRSVTPLAAKLHDRGVPLVFHTGHGAPEALKARWPECRVLLKPARSEELLAAVLAMLERSPLKENEAIGCAG